ncbi:MULTISPECIES: hypothetical protein [unclassified Tatumella]|uniref:hypothetical protein n=1 Tax=unclassified Tatumella TaxID=2649542 RepID=UPI001BAF5F1D|nr:MULTISPECIES: hypothetical protein [unclassified Tatumella]MBS0878051.1 hypothetical protein [Tatumella sp. JGM82]MBS0891226.1 hypothetical protein [Tatumella sp. JGM94]MBS0902605.1 hypothetical protein [Tatumella sp. JGM100]
MADFFYNIVDFSNSKIAVSTISKSIPITSLDATGHYIRDSSLLFNEENLDKTYPIQFVAPERDSDIALRALKIGDEIYMYLSEKEEDIERVKEWVNFLDIKPVS